MLHHMLKPYVTTAKKWSRDSEDGTLPNDIGVLPKNFHELNRMDKTKTSIWNLALELVLYTTSNKEISLTEFYEQHKPLPRKIDVFRVYDLNKFTPEQGQFTVKTPKEKIKEWTAADINLKFQLWMVLDL